MNNKIVFENKIRFYENDFSKIDNKSIDYSFIEKEKKIKLIPLSTGWSDIGSWDSYFNQFDTNKNSTKIIEIDGSNNHYITESRVIASIGVSNLIVVDTNDATLICKKGKTETVKDIVSKLSEHKIIEGLEHPYEKRPWGKFEIIKEEEFTKGKQLTIFPNRQLSLQYHLKRSEPWIIVSGIAEVTLNNETLRLAQGSSIDIPLGVPLYSKQRILI